VRSKERRKIVVSLGKPKTPTEIAKELKLGVSHISRTLKEFKERGLVECLTPNQRMGKVFVLTDKGEEIRKEMMKEEQ